MFNQKEYNKKYRLENKEKVKAIQADYYRRNRENRINNARNWTLKNAEQALGTRRSYMKTPRGRLTSIKGSAKTRKIEYFLNDEDAIKMLSGSCHYCNQNEGVSIDRVDSKGGYTKDNCIPCCKMCNYMKNIYTKESFIEQCKLIAKNHL